MKRPFFWLMAFFTLLLALGVWLLVLGVHSTPYVSPFFSSM